MRGPTDAVGVVRPRRLLRRVPGAGSLLPATRVARRPYTCYRTYQNTRSCGALERLRRMSVTYYRHLVQTSARPSNDRHNKRTHTEEQTNQKVHGLF